MQSLSIAGLILTQTIVNGIHSISCNSNPEFLKRKGAQLVTAVSGFSKDPNEKPRKFQFGDDAWFIQRTKYADVIAVADGVGSWRNYGIDPSQFSNALMRTCDRLVARSNFKPSEPAELLTAAYYELLQSKKQVFGSSTACIMILNNLDSHVYTANVGDSGFLIIRNGKVISESEAQQHSFNAPFQLSWPPDEQHQFIRDRPESAVVSRIFVEDGDIIILATDGLFDNVPKSMLLNELERIHDVKDTFQLQVVANSLTQMARVIESDESYMSPFAINARDVGIQISGGKPDDVTLILATVQL